MEGKEICQMLRIASEHTARVPPLLRSITIADLILCRCVASTSGAHFILKMTLFYSLPDRWILLKLERIQWPKEGCDKSFTFPEVCFKARYEMPYCMPILLPFYLLP